MHDTPASTDALTKDEARPRATLSMRLMKLAKKLLFLYLCWLLLLFFAQRWLIFPDYASPEPGAGEKYDVSTTVLTRDIGGGEKVVAWFIPSPGAQHGKACPLVVYFHGNAELIDTQDFPIELYRSMGCSVLLPEYRGYGRSGGQPSESAIVDDAVYFVDEVLKRPDVDKSRVIIHGRSLGGGVAAQLAAKRKPTALILGSTFTSLRPFANKYLAPGFLVRSPFDTAAILPTLDIPILIQHGAVDNIVPVENGRTLKSLAKNCTYIEYPCSHNDFPGAGNEQTYAGDLEAFLRKNNIVR